MPKMASGLGLALCIAFACSSSKKDADPAVADTTSGVAQGSEVAPEEQAPAIATKEKTAKPAAVVMRKLQGPFDSIEAYCKMRKSSVESGQEDVCAASYPRGIEPEVYLREPPSPYRAATFISEGVNEVGATENVDCSLALQIATGWYVLPALLDCREGTLQVRSVLHFGTGGGARARYLRVDYREEVASSEDGIEVSGTLDHLLLCGPVKGGAVECLPDIVTRSALVKTSKTKRTTEKYLLEPSFNRGRLELTLKMGELPPSSPPLVYPLFFVVPPTLDSLAIYRKHLKTGRALSKKKKYAEAVTEFQLALEATFGGQAQSELGYAAYRAGDLMTSIRASNGAADSADPRVAAASYYNLGLAEEARDDKRDAARAYRRSLELRPSQTVLDRLTSISGAPSPWGHSEAAPRLYTKAELVAEYGDEGEGGDYLDGDYDSFPTGTDVDFVDQGDFSIVKVRTQDAHLFGDSTFLLAKNVDKRYQLIGNVGAPDSSAEDEASEDVYLGFELAVTRQESQSIGDKTVTRLEYTKLYPGNSYHYNHEVSYTEFWVIFCVEEAKRYQCTSPLPLGLDWRASLAEDATELDREVFQQEFETQAPASWSYRTEATLTGSDLTIRSVKGIRAYTATYKLWK